MAQQSDEHLMSEPNEILDSLLSGYLDDALTPDERSRVEQWLSTDADVRRELDSMRDLRLILQSIDRTDRARAKHSIANGFSERVIDAAIERARGEGVAEEHPLLRTTEAPSYRREYSSRGRRVAVALVALAASGLIGAVMIGPSWMAGDAEPIAQQTRISDEPVVSLDQPSVIIDPDPSVAEPLHNAIAASDGVVPQASVSDVANIDPANIEVANIDPANMSGPKSTSNVASASDAVTPATVSTHSGGPLMSVLVLDVRRTEMGRGVNPIRKALQTASIVATDQQPVDEGIVSSITAAVRSLETAKSLAPQTDEISGSVMYIESSAKRIDRFISALIADREGVESVGMNLAMDAPTSNIVRSIPSVNAMEVRDSQIVEFTGELSGTSQDLARHLGSQRFMPWSSDAAPTSLNGPDFLIRIFVLVR